MGWFNHQSVFPSKISSFEVASLKLTAILAPENGCGWNTSLSLWGSLGLISGAKMPLVSGRVATFCGFTGCLLGCVISRLDMDVPDGFLKRGKHVGNVGGVFLPPIIYQICVYTSVFVDIHIIYIYIYLG